MSSPQKSAPTLFSSPWFRRGLVLFCFVALALAAARSVRVQTDFAAFLPASASSEQRLLIAQLRDGLVSRLMLVALSGVDEETLASSSHALAAKLAAAPEFEYAANGSLDQLAAQSAVLMQYRYVLSPDITAEKFSAGALHAALSEQLAQLASPFGVVSRATLARDPTGELFAVFKHLTIGGGPALRQGVWFSADGKRAFLLAQTRAAGFDSVQQAAAAAKIKSLLAEVNPKVQIVLTGPGVFAAESQRLIERDAVRLSLCSAAIVLLMLMVIYRSVLPLALVVTPVAFGLLLGVLVVQALFGSVHGITLGFAATLIGEAVDYPNYLLLNTAPGESAASAARRIRPTLTLAVLTTIASALALALSSFTGLAQLGVLTMVGVAVAGLMTHQVIPWLLGARPLNVKPLRLPFFPTMANTSLPVALALAATAAAALWLAYTYPGWWEQDLANISPIPREMRMLDAELRRDMSAPEVGSLLASSGDSEQAALRAAEQMLPVLQQWQAKGLIHSFDSPAFYLPSPEMQAARLKALPGTQALRLALQQALQGLPFRADAFAPFVEDMARARESPPLTRAAYAGTPLGAKLAALLVNQDGRWLALTTLGGVADPASLPAALAALPAGQQQSSQLVDLKQVSTRMVSGYRQEALQQATLGAALIVLLLVIGLRSLRRSLRVLAPNAAALILTIAILIALGQLLSVFHLVALLLVVGIGLNYALFFERTPADAAERARTRLSLAVCSLSTIVTFSFLGSSSTPVLRAIGSTVALGALLSLLLSAFWTQRRETLDANEQVMRDAG